MPGAFQATPRVRPASEERQALVQMAVALEERGECQTEAAPRLVQEGHHPRTGACTTGADRHAARLAGFRGGTVADRAQTKGLRLSAALEGLLFGTGVETASRLCRARAVSSPVARYPDAGCLSCA
eukprot:3773543-Pleurochrysis_carterae.AAC.3